MPWLRKRAAANNVVRIQVQMGWSQGTGTYNDDDHTKHAFASDKQCSTCQDDDSHRDGNDGQDELSIEIGRHHDEKLYGKSEKEEEIELEQSDVDLQDVGQNFS